MLNTKHKRLNKMVFIINPLQSLMRLLKRSLDVEQGRKCRAPSKDRTLYSVVFDPARQAW